MFWLGMQMPFFCLFSILNFDELKKTPVKRVDVDILAVEVVKVDKNQNLKVSKAFNLVKYWSGKISI